MNTRLKKFYKKNKDSLSIESFSIDLNQNKNVKGLLISEHVDFEKVKNIAGNKLHVYAIRHTDDESMDPATIEKNQVNVNFYGYFVTEENLDGFFEGIEDQYLEICDFSFD